ncbi:MAG TPA: hypothetical protein VGD98_07110 [Ktedonobacteraceae bacterium]
MQCWRHGWLVEILEYPIPESNRTANAFMAYVKQFHCQGVLKPLSQKRCNRSLLPYLAVTVCIDPASMVKIDIFHSTSSCAEIRRPQTLEQLYIQAASAHDLIALRVMLPLFVHVEYISLKRVFYSGFFGWLRKLIASKNSKQKLRAGEKKPEQSKLPTEREGGRGPREPREPDTWE